MGTRWCLQMQVGGCPEEITPESGGTAAAVGRKRTMTATCISVTITVVVWSRKKDRRIHSWQKLWRYPVGSHVPAVQKFQLNT